MTKKLNDVADTPQDNAWTSLLGNTNTPESVVLKMEDMDKDSNTLPGTPCTPATPATATPASQRKVTLLSAFHRNLRMSIKAVTESPGHISR